eukprot:Selendium_serpulae@DN9400_c0_g1_i1.p1
MGAGVFVDYISRRHLCCIFGFTTLLYAVLLITVGLYGPSALRLQSDGPVVLQRTGKTPRVRRLGNLTQNEDTVKRNLESSTWLKKIIFQETYDHYLSLAVRLSNRNKS